MKTEFLEDYGHTEVTNMARSGLFKNTTPILALNKHSFCLNMNICMRPLKCHIPRRIISIKLSSSASDIHICLCVNEQTKFNVTKAALPYLPIGDIADDTEMAVRSVESYSYLINITVAKPLRYFSDMITIFNKQSFSILWKWGRLTNELNRFGKHIPGPVLIKIIFQACIFN